MAQTETATPATPLRTRIADGAGRFGFRFLVLPLTCAYLLILTVGLAALGYSAIRAVLSALGLLSGGAFDWLPA